ncbi:hypothetical protein L6232_02155 [Shewanella sp. C31]|nr:hypothetical protein [Shewanella electrica]
MKKSRYLTENIFELLLLRLRLLTFVASSQGQQPLGFTTAISSDTG